jgi:hypothetical protein
MRPHLQRRLNDMGRGVPMLEGYGCAIEMAKLLVNLRHSADHPRQWRRKVS